MAALIPQYIDGPAGRLFLIHHVPDRRSAVRAVVVLPAFAEEMNKARRQVALTARALTARGIGVLVPDLRGMGDSDGELGDATVTGLVDDVEAVVHYARTMGYRDIDFLGLRGGALLGVALQGRASQAPARFVLWQPVLSGKTMINQFLRLKAAAGLMADSAGVSVRELREQLAAGNSVEVAGYELSPELVAGFDALELGDLHGAARVDWLQIGRADDTPLPAARRALDAFAAKGIDCRYRGLAGDPFWATAEIATVPELCGITADIVAASA